MRIWYLVAIVEMFVIAYGLSAPVRGAEVPAPPAHKPPVPVALARPVAGAVPVIYAKGMAILDVDGLKIVNTGNVDDTGHVLLDVTLCKWGDRPYGSAVVCEEPTSERWILGHLHIIQVYTGRVFRVVVNEAKAGGSVTSSFTTSGPGNQVGIKAKRNKPAKTARAH